MHTYTDAHTHTNMQSYSKEMAKMQEAAAVKEYDNKKIVLTQENDKNFVASAIQTVDK